MEVFKFNKTVLQRYDDCCLALKFTNDIISSSKIHIAWQYYLEILLEPAGWQALWKLSRVFCEELQIRYPTVVFGTVHQVCFQECKAEFKVEAVQDEDVNLVLETHFVNLEDLWPVKNQGNGALNIEKTAEAIDNYRFFVNNIWMPWDAENDDEQIDFIDTHFLIRAQLYCDMVNKKISRFSVAKLKLLTNEAREIELKRRELEVDIVSDDEEEEAGNTSTVESRKQKKELIKLNIRMNQIKTEFEILENPKMREVFEEERNEARELIKTHHVIVTKPGNIKDQTDYLNTIKTILGKDENVYLQTSLQEALMNSDPSDTIFVAHTLHKIKFPAPLGDNGQIRAIPDNKLKAIIQSRDEEQFLFVCEGDFKFENLTLDCRNVEVGIVVKNRATVTLKNCHIIGSKNASTHQGILVKENGLVILEKCTFEEHSTGIAVKSTGTVSVKDSQFLDCRYGIECCSIKSDISIENVKFEKIGKFGILMTSSSAAGTPEKIKVIDQLNGIDKLNGLTLKGENVGNMALLESELESYQVILENQEDIEMKNNAEES